MLGSTPLLRPTRDDKNNLLASGMGVKRMTPPGVHVRPHQQQILVRNHVGPAHPFLEGPCGGEANGLLRGNKTSFLHGHKLTSEATRRSSSFPHEGARRGNRDPFELFGNINEGLFN